MAARRYPAIRLGAQTNLALLGLLAIAFLSGWVAFAYATAPARWSLVVHATGGIAILLLLPRKSMIARRGLHRPRPGRWASILLGVIVLISIAAGLAHSTGVLLSWGPFTPMELHVGAAIAAAPLAIWHVVVRRVRTQGADPSRRVFLKGTVAVVAATTTYFAGESLVKAANLPGARRRFTGSYEVGSFNPRTMPVSSWMFDAVPQLDAATWKVRTPGRAWTYDELLAFDDRLTATLDCTGGFYSTQEWSGVRLDRMLPDNNRSSIRVVSSTGYDRRYPATEASSLLLATRFGGVRLDPGHGFPARLVSADRRGFWWVKWVVAIETDDLPHWWQSPFPLQ